MRNFTMAAGFAAMCLFIFACSDTTGNPSTAGAGAGSTNSTSSSSSGGDAAAAIVDMYCNTLAPVFCEADFACCGFPTVGLGASVDECITVAARQFPSLCTYFADRPYIEEALRAGLTVFDQAQFDTCLARLKSLAAQAPACDEAPEHVLITTCLKAFRAQGAPGDACPYESDLWQGRWDTSSLPCKHGRCENSVCVPFLNPGDACSLAQQNNGAAHTNTICDFLNNETCWAAPGGTGGAGGDGGATAMGTCRPLGEIGDACDPGNEHECISLNCDGTGKCIPAGRHAGCSRL